MQDAFQGGILSSTSGRVALDVSDCGHAAVQLTGTWVGTITFQCSADWYQTWDTWQVAKSSDTATLITTAAAAGIYAGATPGFRAVSVYFSAFTSGNCLVSIHGGP